MLENTPNQPSKFKTKDWVEVHDDSRGTYNTNSQVKFKTSMLNSSLCNYSDAYIIVKGTINVVGVGATATLTTTDSKNKHVILKNCAPFMDCISEIYNTQLVNAKVMLMYKSIDV